MFNKRHYEAIATMMQELCPDLPRETDETAGAEYDDSGYDHDALGRQLMWDDMCRELALLFMRDNTRFQLERFIAACQPGANVRLRTRYKTLHSTSV